MFYHIVTLVHLIPFLHYIRCTRLLLLFSVPHLLHFGHLHEFLVNMGSVV